ncbi:DUF2637 domain-containing protein [Micromonospora aurantiaca (nom. illeg.)]|uniref:DUF2637 domain-containing protein n=1 Tax=Micromonospora aurantiaca (nom. illeg.) TaxID=47850 RepID=UPI002E19AA00
MTPTRLARDVSTVAVAGIAAWSSWSHMVAVALRFGERPEVAYVLPLSVDGMLVVASAAMVEDNRAGRRVRWSARTAFAVGVAASVAANIAAAEPSLGARIVAAWPAVALLLVVEMLTRAQPVSPDSQGGTRAPYPQKEPLASGAAPMPSKSRLTDLLPPPVGNAQAGAVSGSATRQVRGSAPQRTGRRKRTAERGQRTVDVVARLRAERPQASLPELASAAGVSERHVRRLVVAAEAGEAEDEAGRP